MSVEEEIKKVILARLETWPKNKKLSIGSKGEFTKDQLIEEVKKDSPIGKKLIQIELEFLKALKEGAIYD